MKKILAVLIACIFVGMLFVPSSIGEDTEYLEIYLTNYASAAIDVWNTSDASGDATWYPGCGIGGNDSTTGDYYNLSNEGTVQVDVTIAGANTTDWTLGTSAGHNVTNVSYDVSGTWDVFTWEAESFADNLAWDEWQNFDLQIYMPTSTSTATNQTITVTFTATVD